MNSRYTISAGRETHVGREAVFDLSHHRHSHGLGIVLLPHRHNDGRAIDGVLAPREGGAHQPREQQMVLTQGLDDSILRHGAPMSRR